MTKKERKARTLRREELLVKYQLVSDFIRQLSVVYEKSYNLFETTVNYELVKNAVQELNDLKALILE